MASVIGTVIVGATTAWYLSMNRNMTGTNDRLEAMTIAMSEWQRLEHMSLDELEANRENYKTPYNVGDKFKVGINLGEQGFFDDGKCNSLTGDYASESPNCLKDTIMTVYDADGSALYTTRSLPLSVGGASIPEGTIWPYTGDLAKIPRGWVLCDGTNGTPDLRGRFLEGTGTSTGEFKSAGLPNITGVFTQRRGSGGSTLSSVGGSFYNSWGGSGSTYQEGNDLSYSVQYVNFSASRSSAVYGKSDTVQPSSYTVFYIMKTNTDFHYNHTNPVDTPSFYTKDEIDQMFSDEKERIANNYLDKSSKEYVHNLTSEYTLALGYNADDDIIQGYVDGSEKQFASQTLDWSNAKPLVATNSLLYIITPVIMPADGLLIVDVHTISPDTQLYFNDVFWGNIHHNVCGWDIFTLPVKKGDKLEFKGYVSNSSATITLIPYK